MDTSLDLLKTIRDKVQQPARTAFWSALIVGLITHGFMFANKITNWDDLMETPGVGAGGFVGRWLLEIINNWFSNWSVPAINGVMMIVLIGLAAIFVVQALGIQSMTGAFLAGAIMVTFPTVASTQTFMFMSAANGLAILITSAGVYVTRKYRYGFIAGALLFLSSLAIYQAFFAYAVTLLLMIALMDLLDDRDIGEVLREAAKYILTLAAGMGIYLISMKTSGYELTNYKGLDNIGHASMREVVISVLRAYHRVIQYFSTKPESYMEGAPTTLSILCILAIVILLVIVIIQKKTYRSAKRMLWLAVGIGLLPLAIGLIYVMASQVDHASTVMIYSYLCVYLCVIVLCERVDTAKALPRAVVIGSSVILLLINYSNFKIDNTAYYRSYMADRRVSAFANRILTKLEAQDGYQYGDKVMILGDSYPEPLKISGAWYMEGEKYYDLEGLALEDGLFMPTNRQHYIEVFLGVEMDSTSSDENTAMMETTQYQEMPVWPADGCVAKIGDAWVVKIE